MFGLDYIESFLNPSDPYEQSEKALKKYYNQGVEFEKPYWQQGLDQYGDLNAAKNKLLNPAELENEWASQYETSPYAKQLLDRNRTQGLEAASSMGLMGSSAALNNIQQGAGQIVAQDRRQFLNDLMEKFMKGIGIGTDMYGVGANAGGALSGAANKMGQNFAGLEYGKAAAPGKLFENLLRTGVGFAAMGPMGAAYAQGVAPNNSTNQYNV